MKSGNVAPIQLKVRCLYMLCVCQDHTITCLTCSTDILDEFTVYLCIFTNIDITSRVSLSFMCVAVSSNGKVHFHASSRR